MPDREKVKQGLLCCSDRTGNFGCFNCPYHEENRNVSKHECSKDVKEDALELLKEHEEAEWTEEGYCSNCKRDIPAFIIDWKWQQYKTRYCPNCGARMKGGEVNE